MARSDHGVRAAPAAGVAAGSGGGPAGGGPEDPERRIAEVAAGHGTRIWRLAFSVLRDRALAEDVLQEVLVKAWMGLPDDPDGAARWLTTVTRNTAISMLRRRRVHVHDAGEEPVSTDPTPETVTEDRERVDAVWAAVADLEPDARAMLVMQAVEGVSYRELAEAFNMTESAVKARLYRARHALRERLGSWEGAR